MTTKTRPYRRSPAIVTLLVVGLLGSTAASATAGPGWQMTTPSANMATRTWGSVDLWQATVHYPRGWVMIDYSSDAPFPADDPVIFQLTNYDPGVRQLPSCVHGVPGQPPPDGVIVTVGSGSLPSLPPDRGVWGQCPVVTETREWTNSGHAYWATVFVRIDGDPLPALRVLDEMVFPPDGVQDGGFFAWKQEPVVVIGTGTGPTGAWALTGGAHSGDLSMSDASGGGGGGPNECPVRGLWGGLGWGTDGGGRSTLMANGLIASRVTEVTFAVKQRRIRAEVFPVPESLYGGPCNVFGFAALGRWPSGWDLGGDLLFFDAKGKLLRRFAV